MGEIISKTCKTSENVDDCDVSFGEYVIIDNLESTIKI